MAPVRFFEFLEIEIFLLNFEGVAQAVSITDRSINSTGTTTLHRLICEDPSSSVVVRGDATVLVDYALTTTIASASVYCID